MDARETSVRTEYMARRLHEAYLEWVKAGRPVRRREQRPKTESKEEAWRQSS